MTETNDFLQPTTSDQHYMDEIRRKAEKTDLNTFRLRCQLPLEGRSDMVAAAAPALSVVLKAYAGGGENTLHAHNNEDHSFIVLQGKATFFGDGGITMGSLGPLEGIMIPRGALYRFEAGVEEQLVMLRVGAILPKIANAAGRSNADGSKADSFALSNKQVPLILSDHLVFG